MNGRREEALARGETVNSSSTLLLHFKPQPSPSNLDDLPRGESIMNATLLSEDQSTLQGNLYRRAQGHMSHTANTK